MTQLVGPRTSRMSSIIDMKIISGRTKESMLSEKGNGNGYEISIEDKILKMLKEGWVLKGELLLDWSQYGSGRSKLIQTMVKYESVNLLN